MKRNVFGQSVDDAEVPAKKCASIDAAEVGNNETKDAAICANEKHNDACKTAAAIDCNATRPKIDSSATNSFKDDSDTETDTSSEDGQLFNKASVNENQTKKAPNPTKSRKFRSLPIYVVDYHHHVLEFIYRCVGSRHLPLASNMLIHFDSHPDMVISHDMHAKDTFNKNIMIEKASIESWIMPLCYTGIITRIVWIKNSWCNQLPNGKHNFHIGEHNGRLYVDLALPYFLAESNYCDSKNLSNARSIELLVLDAGELDAGNELCKFSEAIKLFNGEEMPYILDIDLDFFSVNNPFLSLYEKSNCYEQLSQIFSLETCDMEQVGAAVINQRRSDKLKSLENIFKFLKEHGSLKNYQIPKDTTERDLKSFSLIEKLVDSLKSNYRVEEIEWMLVYDAGCTADSGGLPQHKSNAAELIEQYTRLQRFLQRLPFLPVAITIARSAEDNYCPPDQVDDIEKNVMLYLEQVLENKFNQSTTSIYAYLDEEYNIMEL